MAPPIQGPVVRTSWPVKKRLDAMQDGMQSALGRQVTLSEVIEALLAEHDRNITQEAGA